MTSDLYQQCARPLAHPDRATILEESTAALQWIIDDFVSLPEQRVGQTASRAEMEQILREPVPEAGLPFEAVLAALDEKIKPYTYRTNHPRFYAFVPGAPSIYSILGESLCAGLNLFSGVWVEGAGPSQVEIVILDWFKEFLGYPSAAKGVLTSGGSEANLTALVVARDPLTDEERAKSVLYVTEQRHWSVDRACRVMGLRGDQVHPVPADDQLRLSATHLAEAVAKDRAAGLHPWAVVANAGATNTGTVDPLDALADVCEREKLWLHADAAYGWSAALTPSGKQSLAGIERADSLTLDPHKWFAQTFDTGCLLVRDGEKLPATFSMRPDYLQDVAPTEEEINFADHGIALTRRFRALKIWLSVKVLGLKWYRDLVQRGMDLAHLSEELLLASGHFEILSRPQLSIICFRYVPLDFDRTAPNADEQLNELNQKIVHAIRTTGRFFQSSTRLHGRLALRFCFVNWRTTSADLNEVITWLQQQGEEISANR